MISVKRNLIFHLLLVASNIMFPVLVFPYIARVLGPEGLGNAHFALQFSKYFVMTASLGIPIYGIREVAKVKDNKDRLNKLVSELVALNLITAVISAFVYAAVLYANPVLQQNFALFAIAGVQVLFGFLSVDWLFAGLEDFRIITIRSIFIRIVTVVFLIWFVKQPNDVINYLILVIGSILLGHLLNVVYALGKLKITTKNLNITQHFKPILVIFLINVCITMYTVFDTAWIGFFATAASIGMYTSAIKLTKIGIPIATALGTVLVPKSARTFAAEIKQPTHLSTAFNFIVDVATPIGVGLFCLAPELLQVFSGVAYEQAVFAMRLFSFLPLLIGLNNLFGMQMLSASGNDKLLLIAVFVGMLINIVLNIILIPNYTHNGAAMAMLATEFAVTCITFYYAHKKFTVPFSVIHFLKAALVCVCFVPIIFLVKANFSSQGLVVLISFCACTLLYTIVQLLVFKNEFALVAINMLKQVFGKKHYNR